MSALTSNSGDWQTPPWLVEKCRAALGGYISVDAATSADNPVKADRFYTAADDALGHLWDAENADLVRPTLFLNPPGSRSGKLIRDFWKCWDLYSRVFFHASVWVDFNLDHLRFIERVQGDCLIIPRKRIAFVDPLLGAERRGAPIGGFLLFRGYYGTENGIANDLFPEPDFLTMWGPL